MAKNKHATTLSGDTSRSSPTWDSLSDLLDNSLDQDTDNMEWLNDTWGYDMDGLNHFPFNPDESEEDYYELPSCWGIPAADKPKKSDEDNAVVIDHPLKLRELDSLVGVYVGENNSGYVNLDYLEYGSESGHANTIVPLRRPDEPGLLIIPAETKLPEASMESSGDEAATEARELAAKINQANPATGKRAADSDDEPSRMTQYDFATKFAETYTLGMHCGNIYLRKPDSPVYTLLDKYNVTAAIQAAFAPCEIRSFNIQSAQYLIDRLKTLGRVQRNKLYVSDSVAAFNNGVFDLRTGERVTPPRNMLILNHVDADFTPWKIPPTPALDNFLAQTTRGDFASMQLILCMIGATLPTGAPKRTFFVMGTEKGTGKSMLMRFIERLLDEQLVSTVAFNKLGEKFALSSLVGRTLNLSMEIENGVLSKEAVRVIKLITGGDRTSVEGKYRDATDERLFCTLIGATNFPLKISGNDPALAERLQVVPLLYQPEEQDPNFEEKLWTERDGIVTKAAIAYGKVLQNSGEFPFCAIAEKMKAEWMCNHDVDVEEHIDALKTDGYHGFISTKELYDSFCESHPGTSMTKDSFSKKVGKYLNCKSLQVKINGTPTRGYKI